VAVIGGRQILPKHSFRVRRGTMRVVVGEPISVEGMRFEDRDDLLDRSRQAIADMRGGEGPTAGPASR
jgi:hypothetical protein